MILIIFKRKTMFTAQVTGYLGADAKVTTKEEKTTISFSVSPMGKTDGEVTTWINCFLNRSSGVVEFLKKGTLVYLSGDLKVSVFQKENGDVIPSINLSVNKVELLPSRKDD